MTGREEPKQVDSTISTERDRRDIKISGLRIEVTLVVAKLAPPSFPNAKLWVWPRLVGMWSIYTVLAKVLQVEETIFDCNNASPGNWETGA